MGRRNIFYSSIALIVLMVGGFFFLKSTMSEKSASIKIESDPTGAEVFVSGMRSGTTPMRMRTDVGTYVVKVYKQGFIAQPESLMVKTSIGAIAMAAFRLTPSNGVETVAPGETRIPSRFANQGQGTDPNKYVVPARSAQDQPPTVPMGANNSNTHSNQIAKLQVESNPSGCEIWVDDRPANRVTPATLDLALGIHRVNVKKSGLHPQEGEQVVSLMVSGTTNRVNFQMVSELATRQGKIVVATRPVAGKIKVDGEERGTGELQLTDLAFGEYTISFSPIEGYRTPTTRKVSLNPTDPMASVIGVYEPVVSIGVSLDDRGALIQSNASVRAGVSVGSNFVADDNNGPPKKFYSDNNFWAWEIGYGYTNKNPAGSDALEIRFKLSEQTDKNLLKLRVYGYATNRTFPFSISGKTRITIELNGRTVVAEVSPSRNLDNEDAPGYDEWRIGTWLVNGENKLVIRSSDRSTAYYLLNRAIIL